MAQQKSDIGDIYPSKTSENWPNKNNNNRKNKAFVTDQWNNNKKKKIFVLSTTTEHKSFPIFLRTWDIKFHLNNKLRRKKRAAAVRLCSNLFFQLLDFTLNKQEQKQHFQIIITTNKSDNLPQKKRIQTKIQWTHPSFSITDDQTEIHTRWKLQLQALS